MSRLFAWGSSPTDHSRFNLVVGDDDRLLRPARLRWSVFQVVDVVHPVVRDVALAVDRALLPIVAREEVLAQADLTTVLVEHRVCDAVGAGDLGLLLAVVEGPDHHAAIENAVDVDVVLRHAAVHEGVVVTVVVAVEGGDEPLAVVPELRLVLLDPALVAGLAVLDVHGRKDPHVHRVTPRHLAFLHEDLGDVGDGRAELVVEAPRAVGDGWRRIATSTSAVTSAGGRVDDGRRVRRRVRAAAAGREAHDEHEAGDAEQHRELPVLVLPHG